MLKLLDENSVVAQSRTGLELETFLSQLITQVLGEECSTKICNSLNDSSVTHKALILDSAKFGCFRLWLEELEPIAKDTESIERESELLLILVQGIARWNVLHEDTNLELLICSELVSELSAQGYKLEITTRYGKRWNLLWYGAPKEYGLRQPNVDQTSNCEICTIDLILGGLRLPIDQVLDLRCGYQIQFERPEKFDVVLACATTRIAEGVLSIEPNQAHLKITKLENFSKSSTN